MKSCYCLSTIYGADLFQVTETNKNERFDDFVKGCVPFLPDIQANNWMVCRHAMGLLVGMLIFCNHALCLHGILLAINRGFPYPFA